MTNLTLFIDAGKYTTARELHLALKMMLQLPEHYGCNADALHDCLSERRDAVNLVLFSEGEGEVAEALRKCIKVVEDLDGNIVRL
ncbi:MAG: barstar family protein [Clostridia bacterium]|nr:barstar family protein [Clostridia bacterium]